MSRPKGIKQKRNESKYWLPVGVNLCSNQNDYNKETPLIFNDIKYGEFQSSFKALQNANASTHPKAILERRKTTLIDKYGVDNISNIPRVRRKAQDTMEERYGAKHALQCEQFKDKYKETIQSNHNVTHPMYSVKIKQKLKSTLLEKYGVLVVPGSRFEKEGYVRIGYACDQETLKKGLELLGNALAAYDKSH